MHITAAGNYLENKINICEFTNNVLDLENLRELNNEKIETFKL